MAKYKIETHLTVSQALIHLAGLVGDASPYYGENKMTNFKNLIDLSVDRESSLINDNLAPSVKAALEKRKEQQAEKAAEEIIKLMDAVDNNKTSIRRDLRVYRGHMEHCKKQLDKLDRAFRYGTETGNFIPVLYLTNSVRGGSQVGMTQEEFQEAIKVPDDFKPKSDQSE